MSSNCYKLNPLQRAGTLQDRRALDALRPGNIPIDGRKIEDLILFADKYAELLAYYNSNNQYDGDWKDFIASDISTILARIVKTNYTLIGETYEKYREKLDQQPSPRNHKLLFDIIFSLFLEIQRMNKPVVFNTLLEHDLKNEILKLREDLKNLIAYYKGRAPAGILEEYMDTNYRGESFKFRDADSVLREDFSATWIVKDNGVDASWSAYYDSILPDSTIYGDGGWTEEARIDYSLSFIKAIFNRAYEAYIRLIKKAAQYFQHSLEKHPDHNAHNALLLVFFKLFFYAQEDLNRLTERHLRFYFEEVLKLKKKPAHPDSVHILVQLAKHKDTHLVKAGTQLKTGKDLIYKVDSDLVVNKAEVAELKAIFIDSHPENGGVYDAPAANSLDGLGQEALDPEKPYWRTFGQPQKNLEEKGKTTMQRSEIGFAIASPVLRLKQGIRRITFKLFIEQWGSNSTLSEKSLVNALEVTFSGEKEWIKGGDFSFYASKKKGTPSAVYTIKVTLGKDVGPVKDFNPENLGGGFDTPWPVARILIKKDAYKLLRGIKINRILIETKVNGLQDLVLANDQGPLDPAKPFLPFGPRPMIGSNFYIGSHEAFSKNLSYIKFIIEWMGLPDSFVDYSSYHGNVKDNSVFKVDISFLKNGQWHPFKEEPLFSEKNGEVYKIRFLKLVTTPPIFLAEPGLEVFKNYNLNLKGGFLRLKLSAPPNAFGHNLFPTAYSKQAIEMAKGKNVQLPKEPYTPTIQCISLKYEATSDIFFGNKYNQDNGQFFHIHPFGYKEVKEPTVHLVPQFLHEAKEKDTAQTREEPIDGALYIGIKNIEPQQTVAILCQLAEGTEDVSKDAPTVFWSFLEDNRWARLDDCILADSTNNLLGSGIIRFKIPKEANPDNTLMPKGLRWLRASIKGAYDAFPQMIDVKAQALCATFADRENDSTHLASPLKAESINKLLKSDSAIKKIHQPYESFNGRMQEQDDVFYNRVSERLRHKNRAITIWDYERLVLEEFPFIYKVKCLNHTNDSTEMAPGSVRIVVIPDMRNKKAGSRFEPAVSNNTRKKIKEYLEKLSCDFIDLAVENPRYEAIKVKCKVAFYKDFDPIYYKEQLKTDIDKFLAPWAFEKDKKIQFGGTLDQSVIINFVEHLQYVDFVTDFYLDLYINDKFLKSNVSEVIASTSRSILTSHQEHNIGIIVQRS